MANQTNTGSTKGNGGQAVSKRVAYLGYVFASALHPAGAPKRPLVHQLKDGKVVGKSAVDFTDFLNMGETDGLCSCTLCRGEGLVETAPLATSEGIVVNIAGEGRFFPLGANCLAAIRHAGYGDKIVTLKLLRERQAEYDQAAAKQKEAAKVEAAKQKGLERLFSGDCRQMLVEATSECAAAGSSHTCEGDKRYIAILFKGKWTIKAICAKANRARAAAKSQIKGFETEAKATEFVAEREAAFAAEKAKRLAAKPEAKVETPVVKTEPAAEPMAPPKVDTDEVKADDGNQKPKPAKKGNKKPFKPLVAKPAEPTNAPEAAVEPAEAAPESTFGGFGKLADKLAALLPADSTPTQ